MPLPSNYDVILCEGVREEKRNKLTLNGVFLGDDVIIQAGTPVESIKLMLTYIIRFKNGAGSWNASWKVIDSEGETLTPDNKVIEFTKKKDSYAILAIQFAGHKVKNMGKHSLIITLDDGEEEYTYDYNIKFGDVEK
jgi:hypothetical protein